MIYTHVLEIAAGSTASPLDRLLANSLLGNSVVAETKNPHKAGFL